MIDKSFQALVLSIIVHLLITLLISRMPSQSETHVDQPIEVTIQETPTSKGTFVPETETKEDLLDRLRDQAKYLSQYNKRVKEEMLAQRIDKTKNRAGKDPSLDDEARFTQQGGKRPTPEGVGETKTNDNGMNMFDGGQGPFGRQVMEGQSTAGEYIPGVKRGAFNTLNTDRFTFYTFYSRINEQVRNRWVMRLRNLANSLSQQEIDHIGEHPRITEFIVQLNPEGSYVRTNLIRSSGIASLDHAAMDAVRDAAPFLNPPKEMVKESGFIDLHYGFMVE